MKIAFRKKEVVKIVHYVYLNGEKFKLFDILGTLEACMDRENIEITNQRMVKFLKENGILKHNGSRRHLSRATLHEDVAAPLIKKLAAKRERIYDEWEKEEKKEKDFRKELGLD